MNEPTKIETVSGYTEVTIGDNAAVRVYQLPLRSYPDYLKAQDDEIAMAILLTKQDRAWVESLSPESHVKIIDEGDRINADFFSAWLVRRNKRLERIIPGFAEKIARTIAPVSP